MVLLLNSEPAEPEEKLPPQTSEAPPASKSIDGVKPVPKLSGENQEHHLGETAARRRPPAEETAQQAQPAQQENLSPKAKPAGNGFPYVAVSLAVLTASVLAALAVYRQLNAG